MILREHPATLMIWEGAPAAETVERLAETGVSSVEIGPCGNAPAEGDFLSVMRDNLGALGEVTGN